MITRLASICERNELFTRFCTVCPVICRGRRKYQLWIKKILFQPDLCDFKLDKKLRAVSCKRVSGKRSKSRLGLGGRPALSFSWKKIIVCTQPLHFSKLDPLDLISVFFISGENIQISYFQMAHCACGF